MASKKRSLKKYKINENDTVIELTMEATGISRREAIKVIEELSYRVDHPRKKQKAFNLLRPP